MAITVTLCPGYPSMARSRAPTSEGLVMAAKCLTFGAAIAPREVDFCPALPRTRSGKIMRRLLRARALGLPEGDLSTLEPGS